MDIVFCCLQLCMLVKRYEKTLCGPRHTCSVTLGGGGGGGGGGERRGYLSFFGGRGRGVPFIFSTEKLLL